MDLRDEAKRILGIRTYIAGAYTQSDEAIRKIEAYREVAIRQDLVSTNPSANREKAEQYCDEEASRLLAERRQSD